MAKPLTNAFPEERESTRIRAFLARVIPLKGCEVGEPYWEGRSLIQGLAVAFEAAYRGYHWDAGQCATVVDFLTWVQPIKCYCKDDNSPVSAICGLHAILGFVADELRRSAPPKVKARRRAA